jgi:hypothetical protein
MVRLELPLHRQALSVLRYAQGASAIEETLFAPWAKAGTKANKIVRIYEDLHGQMQVLLADKSNIDQRYT